MRVHELAKATQLESKDIIAIAKKHRVAIKPSPSANVEDKDIRKLMPHIEKHKAEAKNREEDERRKKEEERRKKDEERRKKEEERRAEADVRRRQDDDSRRKADEEARAEARKKVDETKRQREEQAKLEREEESRRRQEDNRLRSLGLPVPNRAAGFRPRIAPPAPPPRAPEPSQASPSPATRPTAPRPGMGGFNQEARPRPTPGGGSGIPGQQRPGGEAGQSRPPQSGEPRQGFRPGAGAPGSGPRPQGQGYQGQRPQGQGYQGQRPQGQGYQGQRPQGQGYQGGQRPQGQGYQGQRPQGQGYQGQRSQGQGYQGQRPPGQGGYQGRPQGPGGPGGGQRPPFGARAPQQGGQRPPGSGTGDRRRDDGGAPKLTEGNLPQIGVMRLDKAAPRRGDKDRRPAADAKKKGKVAPRKIFELDEDMTVTSKPKAPGSPRVPSAPGGFSGGRFGSRRPGGRKVKRRYDSNQDATPSVKSITVEGSITVAEFAAKIGISPTEIIKKVLLDMGEALTMNAVLDEEHVTLLAPEFGVELEYIPVGDEYDVEAYVVKDEEEKMVRRPPVVTIMGHVDHGKTSLLDYVRNSNVVKGEFGGITQHIGAYLVHTAKGDIVFLDTPGHEAFTSMRARGAGVTDLVILVVAANDGFKPQTIEALNHAKAAQVPIVVAVNKIDLPGADPAKVRQEALQHNLVPEELGGDIIFVDISAKQGTNVEQLLEMVALQAEILDLKADPDRPAQGTVVESHMDAQRGAVATVLVQKGTLRAGDHFVAGDISGRVRAMNNDRGKATKIAGPSIPVEILGLTASPQAGEVFLVMPDDATAKKVAGLREIRRRAAGLAPVTNRHVTLESLHDMMEEGKTQDLNLIIKGDVQGSVEAIRHSLEKLSNEQIRLRFLHLGVGGVNESDVNLAAASDAVIIGFNVRPEQAAQELADHEGVEIKSYRIIYDLIEEVKAAMLGLLSPTYKEKILGHAEVRQIFRASRLGTIAGCYVKDGEIVRDTKVRVLRDNVVVYEGDLGSLRRVKEDVKRVTTNMECGITVANFNDVKEGDIIESYELEQVAPTLNAGTAAN